ncbi:copper chaperone PCu(A)C [Janibacter melonis]|uniref:copper chaperone PCu(A)C n=1 Tax=Janibacter melonis TaxID=262209 RepID=UPI002094CBA7|nr:copper chaperone PCu(A)C [Janibacter melonis]
MTAAFGTLTNTGDEDVVITGGRSDLAGMVEAHVMSKDENGAMVMEEAKDGHTVPAGASSSSPRGAHLMLMDLSSDVVAGEDYVVTVTTADGQEVDLTFAGREFSGAEEEYAPGMSHDGHETSATSSSSR